MRTVEIFEYRGCVGAKSNIENGEFLNDPSSPSQLGIVVSTDGVYITPSALSSLKASIKKLGGSFASTMLTKGTDGKMSVGMIGFNFHLLKSTPNDKFEIGRTCDENVLDHLQVVDDISIPEDFKEYVDNTIGAEKQVVDDTKGFSVQQSIGHALREYETDKATSNRGALKHSTVTKLLSLKDRVSEISEMNKSLARDIDRNSRMISNILADIDIMVREIN